MRLLCCHGRLLNSDDHLACHPERHLELRLAHPHQRIRHQHLPDEVHQIHLGDLHLDVGHRNHLDDRHLDDLVHLDVDHRSHLDDRRLGDHHLGDLVHPDERLLVEELRSHRHQLDVVQRYRK